MPTFGEQLIAARRAKRMTQETLSQTINVARNTISSWERGRTLPDAASLHRLSDVLGYEFVLPSAQAASVTDAMPATSENLATPVTPATSAIPETLATEKEPPATSSMPSVDKETAAGPAIPSDDEEPAATPSTDSEQFIVPSLFLPA